VTYIHILKKCSLSKKICLIIITKEVILVDIKYEVVTFFLRISLSIDKTQFNLSDS